MIKPDSLRTFITENDDMEMIGRVMLALGDHETPLSSAEKAIVNMIRSDSMMMDDAVTKKREAWRRRTEKHRNSSKPPKSSTPPMSRIVTPCHSDNNGVTVHPTVLPTVLPTDQPTNINNRSDADTRVREESPHGRGGTASASESEQIAKAISKMPGNMKRTDVWEWTDDDIRYGHEEFPMDAAALLSCAFGKGAWRKAVAQSGEDAVRELFITFRNEIRVGETVDNPAAAFIDRCKQDLGVDFKLSMEESFKRGKAANGTFKEKVA